MSAPGTVEIVVQVSPLSVRTPVTPSPFHPARLTTSRTGISAQGTCSLPPSSQGQPPAFTGCQSTPPSGGDEHVPIVHL